jgi:hypothetical protein
MKLVTKAWASVFLHAPADEVTPEQGLLQKDLIEFVTKTYEFSSKPIVPPGLENIPNLAFKSGKLVQGDKTYPIHQIMAYLQGDAVTATTTEVAELVMTDYLRRLDTGLGYRYGDRDWKRTYASGVVVEFEKTAGDHIAALEKVEGILNKRMPRPEKPFKLKSIAFGFGDPLHQLMLSQIDAAQKMDFSLQRRAGFPYSRNCFFSTAPLPTDDHLQLLEEIERTLLKE